MDYKGAAARLHDLERRVLLALKMSKSLDFESLVTSSGVNRDGVQRALLWLSSKGFVSVKDNIREEAVLTKTGNDCVKNGLPEEHLLKLVSDKSLTIKDLGSKFSREELNAALGIVKAVGGVSILEGLVKITSVGREFLKTSFPEAVLLKRIKGSLVVTDEFKDAIKSLKSRGLVDLVLKSDKTVSLAPDGEKILEFVRLEDFVEKLTPEMLATGSWKDKSFRAYDVTSPVPRTFPGKKHFLYQVAEMVKGFFTEMGFAEMRSNYVESSFWNYDVMFFPQDHPDRSIMDTFYVEGKSEGVIPAGYAELVKKVQENGWTTGSKGRMTSWDINEAKKLILRCHTTQTTFRYLAKKLEPPYKFFSIDRVFRNETVDYKHLPEFHQVEGFVVDNGLNFRNLLGFLKEFYSKMGVKKLRFKPTYNPYTEPSTEIFGWFERLGKWIELGNSGVFRPEVLKPVGVDAPVIAWGLALERLAMFVYDIDDIRQCLGHTVEFNNIRNKEVLTRIKK